MRKLIIILAFLTLTFLPVISLASENTTDKKTPVESANTNATTQTDPLLQAMDSVNVEPVKEIPETAAPAAAPEKNKSDDALKYFIMSKNSALNENAAMNFVKSMNSASSKYGVDRELIAAVVWIESNFDPNNVTGRCIGLMQIHVNTGKSLGLSESDLYNSDLSIKYGTKYLSGHIASYNGDVLKALSAYNQGTGRVNSGNYSTWYQEKVSGKWNQVEKYVADYIASH